MSKHLLDETAEFKMPAVTARHAAEDREYDDELPPRLDGGDRQQQPQPR